MHAKFNWQRGKVLLFDFLLQTVLPIFTIPNSILVSRYHIYTQNLAYSSWLTGNEDHKSTAMVKFILLILKIIRNFSSKDW